MRTFANKPLPMANKNLNAAKAAKKDEFYTQLEDINNELRHYREHFRGKTVLCNCDDPRISNFFTYFAYNFEFLGLKRLITTCYKNQDMDLFSQGQSEKAIYLIYEGDKNGNNIPDPEEIGIHPLKGDGDFRSKECIELLKQADIVVTNPPFSLFREYVAQLMEYEKKFLIIGNKNLLTKKEIFPLIMQNRLWVGCTPMSQDLLFEWPKEMVEEAIADGKQGSKYRIVDGKVLGRSPSIWYTNLDIKKRHEEIILYKSFSADDYPHYDNYDAIDVSRVEEIPYDYDGAMGVPLSFMDKYNPEQFELLGLSSGRYEFIAKPTKRYINPKQYTNGKESNGGKVNTHANILYKEKPVGKTYYTAENADGYLVSVYDRIFIRRKK